LWVNAEPVSWAEALRRVEAGDAIFVDENVANNRLYRWRKGLL